MSRLRLATAPFGWQHGETITPKHIGTALSLCKSISEQTFTKSLLPASSLAARCFVHYSHWKVHVSDALQISGIHCGMMFSTSKQLGEFRKARPSIKSLEMTSNISGLDFIGRLCASTTVAALIEKEEFALLIDGVFMVPPPAVTSVAVHFPILRFESCMAIKNHVEVDELFPSLGFRVAGTSFDGERVIDTKNKNVILYTDWCHSEESTTWKVKGIDCLLAVPEDWGVLINPTHFDRGTSTYSHGYRIDHVRLGKIRSIFAEDLQTMHPKGSQIEFFDKIELS